MIVISRLGETMRTVGPLFQRRLVDRPAVPVEAGGTVAGAGPIG
jgi:hypothetical protein